MRVAILSILFISILSCAKKTEPIDSVFVQQQEIPTENSTKYTDPITVEKEGTYSFKAFHPDWKPSTTTILKLYKKGIIPNKIDWQTTAQKAL